VGTKEEEVKDQRRVSWLRKDQEQHEQAREEKRRRI
jgi:hypothetical protein